MHIPRTLLQTLGADIDVGQSVLLLGPRQTGKTTLIQEVVSGSANVFTADLVHATERDRYAVNPDIIIDEVSGMLVAILSASSARKLRRGHVNLLPGRVVVRTVLPLSSEECREVGWKKESATLFGRRAAGRLGREANRPLAATPGARSRLRSPR